MLICSLNDKDMRKTWLHYIQVEMDMIPRSTRSDQNHVPCERIEDQSNSYHDPDTDPIQLSYINKIIF